MIRLLLQRKVSWFWNRMHQYDNLIGELTSWSTDAKGYSFEEAVADAFDDLARQYQLNRMSSTELENSTRNSIQNVRKSVRTLTRGIK